MKTNTELLLLMATPVLTREAEQLLFERLGMAKILVEELEAIDNKVLYQHSQLYYARILLKKIQSEIVNANIPLVAKIAHKMNCPGLSLDEFISEGLMKILECIDAFKVEKGYKFSTYLYTALYRHFGRWMEKEVKRNANRIGENEPEIQEVEAHESSGECDELVEVLDRNLANLSTLEMAVIRGSFGVGVNKVNWGQLSEILSEGQPARISIARLRDIQAGALVKLRVVLEEAEE